MPGSQLPIRLPLLTVLVKIF
ncbi:Hypothetical protein J6891_02522 [Nakaseomyces glabratus]